MEYIDVESDLVLLGATAVEDLLQERVKECIEDFRAAGISVWMLTGDKKLTAKEIGVSCGLIPKPGDKDAEPDSNSVTSGISPAKIIPAESINGPATSINPDGPSQNRNAHLPSEVDA